MMKNELPVYALKCMSQKDPVLETTDVEKAALAFLNADSEDRPCVIISIGNSAGIIASCMQFGTEGWKKSSGHSPLDGNKFGMAYEKIWRAEQVKAERMDDLDFEQSQKIASQFDIISRELFLAAEGQRRKLDGIERSKLITLIEAAMASQVYAYSGDDPMVSSLNKMLEPHQHGAMSVARSLAAHDGHAASIGFVSDRLQQAYDSEKRLLHAVTQGLPDVDVSKLLQFSAQSIEIPKSLVSMIPAAVKFPSRDWFDKALNNVDHQSSVPVDIRCAVERMCTEFEIRGTSDPMLIANVIAAETDRGDGCCEFYGDAPVQPRSEVLDRLASRFAKSYASRTGGDVAALRSLLETTLGGVPKRPNTLGSAPTL